MVEWVQSMQHMNEPQVTQLFVDQKIRNGVYVSYDLQHNIFPITFGCWALLPKLDQESKLKYPYLLLAEVPLP